VLRTRRQFSYWDSKLVRKKN